MPMDPAKINREKVRSEEEARRRMQHLVRQIIGALAID